MSEWSRVHNQKGKLDRVTNGKINFGYLSDFNATLLLSTLQDYEHQIEEKDKLIHHLRKEILKMSQTEKKQGSSKCITVSKEDGSMSQWEAIRYFEFADDSVPVWAVAKSQERQWFKAESEEAAKEIAQKLNSLEGQINEKNMENERLQKENQSLRNSRMYSADFHSLCAGAGVKVDPDLEQEFVLYLRWVNGDRTISLSYDKGMVST